jgi:hydrogenase/urease accessory protein HupE
MAMLTRLLLAGLLLLQSSWAYAHPPGLSSVELQIGAGQLIAKITFALQDIEAFAPMDSDLDAEVSDAEREAAKPAVARLLAEQFMVTIDSKPVQPTEPGSVSYDEQNNAHVELRFAGQAAKQLLLQSKLLSMLPEGHQQFVTVKNAAGHTLLEKMLGRTDDRLQLNLADADQQSVTDSSTFLSFLKLGIEHIITGYDHLLFLFALLAVTHSFWPAIRIITFFTIAHSITLALASLNLIDLPSSFVEPFIAATIVYVAVENIIRGDHPKGRQWLTFGFGLIHGFGFASVLRELDIASGDSGILVPLLSFNLGIESGQIAVEQSRQNCRCIFARLLGGGSASRRLLVFGANGFQLIRYVAALAAMMTYINQ